MNYLKLTLLTLLFNFLSCFSFDEFISYTPFWYINNTHNNYSVKTKANNHIISSVNHISDGTTCNYRLINGIIEFQENHGFWKYLESGNPCDCDGKVLKALHISADNNRTFIIAENMFGERSLWWYCLEEDLTRFSNAFSNISNEIRYLTGYKSWFEWAHQDNKWNNLLIKRPFMKYLSPRFLRVNNNKNEVELKVETFNVPRTSIDVYDIVDIAVGHWDNVGVTYYVLMASSGKIMYIDEDLSMDRWKIIPKISNGDNNPFPLDSNSRIAAAHSIICTSKKIDNQTFIYWIRWDFHNKRDLKNFSSEWHEMKWHVVESPFDNIDYIDIETDINNDKAWKLLPNRKGKYLLDSMDLKEISSYSLRIMIEKDDSLAILNYNLMDYTLDKKIKWKDWLVHIQR